MAPAHVFIEKPTGSVTVGPSGVLGGAWRYPDRTNDQGTFVEVRFSAVPVYHGSGNAVLPQGMPVSSARISSAFGKREHPILGGVRQHAGVDLAVPTGTPVAATSEGTVTFAGWSGGYGLLVKVKQPKGLETRFAHLSRTAVTVGQQVKRGEIIGFAGSTGRSTGPHVHYEVRLNGRPLNPLAR
ncbi:M23 family metallopeptidase [Novosphingobium malaysiense]|uniref:M23 family metallopeptidase n=1 Tax=Novosphingobium malaysiense TaxID=1348853 RepID=UPI0012E07EF9|nr:M23 family metallopeptidase [Novosphingobium malaysiense]